MSYRLAIGEGPAPMLQTWPAVDPTVPQLEPADHTAQAILQLVEEEDPFWDAQDRDLATQETDHDYIPLTNETLDLPTHNGDSTWRTTTKIVQLMQACAAFLQGIGQFVRTCIVSVTRQNGLVGRAVATRGPSLVIGSISATLAKRYTGDLAGNVALLAMAILITTYALARIANHYHHHPKAAATTALLAGTTLFTVLGGPATAIQIAGTFGPYLGPPTAAIVGKVAATALFKRVTTSSLTMRDITDLTKRALGNEILGVLLPAPMAMIGTGPYLAISKQILLRAQGARRQDISLLIRKAVEEAVQQADNFLLTSATTNIVSPRIPVLIKATLHAMHIYADLINRDDIQPLVHQLHTLYRDPHSSPREKRRIVALLDRATRALQGECRGVVSFLSHGNLSNFLTKTFANKLHPQKIEEILFGAPLSSQNMHQALQIHLSNILKLTGTFYTYNAGAPSPEISFQEEVNGALGLVRIMASLYQNSYVDPILRHTGNALLSLDRGIETAAQVPQVVAVARRVEQIVAVAENFAQHVVDEIQEGAANLGITDHDYVMVGEADMILAEQEQHLPSPLEKVREKCRRAFEAVRNVFRPTRRALRN